MLKAAEPGTILFTSRFWLATMPQFKAIRRGLIPAFGKAQGYTL